MNTRDPIGIVIIAHGSLAVEFLSTVEYILDEVQEGVFAVSVNVSSDIVQKQHEISKAVEKADRGKGVLVVTDMHGSTPANIALRALRDKNIDIICGANLPMVLKLVKSRHLSIEEAKALALQSGRQYVYTMTQNQAICP